MNSSIFIIPMVITGFASLIGTALVAVFQYKGGKRTAAGTVDSADARLVFGEAREMIMRLREEVTAQRGEITELRRENEELRRELEELREHLERGFCSKDDCDTRLRAFGRKMGGGVA